MIHKADFPLEIAFALGTQREQTTWNRHTRCKPRPHIPNSNYIPTAHVGTHVGTHVGSATVRVRSVTVRVRSATVRVRSATVCIGSARLFECSGWGSKPM